MIQNSSQMWCSVCRGHSTPGKVCTDGLCSLTSQVQTTTRFQNLGFCTLALKKKNLKLQSSPTSHTEALNAKLSAKRAPTYNCSLSLPVDTMLWKLWEVGNYSHPFNQGYSLGCLNTMLFKNGHFYIKGRRKSTARVYCISDWISFSCRNM